MAFDNAADARRGSSKGCRVQKPWDPTYDGRSSDTAGIVVLSWSCIGGLEQIGSADFREAANFSIFCLGAHQATRCSRAGSGHLRRSIVDIPDSIFWPKLRFAYSCLGGSYALSSSTICSRPNGCSSLE